MTDLGVAVRPGSEGIIAMSVSPGAGFDQSFDHLLAVAYRPALAILTDRAAAEDVAAETLARAYVRWSRLRDRDHREAWVARVATNLAIDEFRRRKRHEPIESGLRVRDVEQELDLHRALLHLSRRQRQVIACCFLVGLTEAETARVLRVSIGSVKTHVHRALRALRSQLDREEPADG